jgi:hypothetical protein
LGNAEFGSRPIVNGTQKVSNLTIPGWLETGVVTLNAHETDTSGNYNRTTRDMFTVWAGYTRAFVIRGSNKTAAPSNIVVFSSTGAVLVNSTALSNSTNSAKVDNTTLNARVSVELPYNSFVIFNKINISTMDENVQIETVNLTNAPLYMDRVSPVVASDIHLAEATISIAYPDDPNKICRCDTWNFGTSVCSGAWVCNDTATYQHKYSGGRLYFNISHFSAYVVGEAGFNLGIWDDTNDVEGLNTAQHIGDRFGFFANFTNQTDEVPVGAVCDIFQDGGATTAMLYNTTSKLFYNYTSFASTGGKQFNVTCVGGETLSAVDGFIISTVPIILGSTTWSQVFWFTAENVAHSILYGIYNTTYGCDQTHMFYVEPAPINGIAYKLNATSDQTGQYACQNDTQGAFKVVNDGSVGLNITMVFSQVTPGVRPKVGYSNGGWKDVCTGTCDSALCDLTSDCVLLNTGPKQIIYNLLQNSTKEIWMWADFKGVGGALAATKGNLTSEATKAL